MTTDENPNAGNQQQGSGNENQRNQNWDQGNWQQQGNQGNQSNQHNQNQGNQQQQNTFNQSAQGFNQGYNQMVNSSDNKKVLAGLMGIFLGGFGVHKFVLGYVTEGFILLGICLISIPLFCVIIGAFTIYIPFIIGLIEGIIYLTKSDQEFYQTYQVGRKPWF